MPGWLTLRLVGWLVGAGLLLFGAWSAYSWADGLGYARGIAELHRYQGEVKAERTKAEREARDREAQHRQELADIDARHQQELRNAQATAGRVVADLRAGNLRLRREWAGCETAARVSEATAGTSSAYAAAELRAAAAGRIVRIGAECDARVRGLQQVIKAQ